MRINKTINNLEKIWKQLDDSCGNLDNALINLSSMTGLDQKIINSINQIDFTSLVILKNEVEEMIENKKQNNIEEDRINKDNWYFESDIFECEKCKTTNESYKLELYLGGLHNGEEAQKYVCSNPNCDFEEIKTYSELYEKEYGK